MLREYSHTKSERLAQIRTIMAKIQHFFLRDCFLLARPVHLALMLRRQCPSVCDGSALGRGACREHSGCASQRSWSRHTIQNKHGRLRWRGHLALCYPLLGPLVTHPSTLQSSTQFQMLAWQMKASRPIFWSIFAQCRYKTVQTRNAWHSLACSPLDAIVLPPSKYL